MQNTKMSTGEYVLFSIPVDMLEEAGIGEERVAGTFFVVGEDGENFRSLTENEVTRYMDRFQNPEDIDQDEAEADMGITFYSM